MSDARSWAEQQPLETGERSVLLLKQCDQTKRQPKQSGQQLRVSIAKLSSLDPCNKRLDLCGVSRILVRIFLHKRRRRFYAARRSEARASEPFCFFQARFPQAHDGSWASTTFASAVLPEAAIEP